MRIVKNVFLKSIWVLVLPVLFAVSCKKKAYDDFYGRPATLEQPIYQQLQDKGNFKNLLAVVDKAGYKDILSAAGYWTFFAPHDSAFQVYFKEKNITSVDQLDSSACRKLVTYCLVYNAFKKERMGDYQSNIGWVPNQSFRRRTANYTGVYDGKDTTGKALKIISSNRNNNGVTFYVDADNNNKYIPCFVDNFLQAKGLTAADYNYFYPTTTFTGFNIVDAAVTQKDIVAENGVIHIINRVITVLPGIDEYISGNPNFSEFKKLFDKFLINYALNPTATSKYQSINGGSAQIYTKIYNAALAFSPNNENFLKQQDNDGQSNSYTLFVPTNDVLLNYINTVLLEKYPNINSLPINVIYDFVNAHMWQSAVWPSKFKSTYNSLGEEARFDPNTNVVDKKILSNGIFYGTNKVQEANVFSSVYAKAYLDPSYTMMTSLLNQELKYQLINLNQKYTLFLISNAALNAAGYFIDVTVSNDPNYQWRYTPPLGGTTLTGSSALVRLLRVINTHVIPGVDITSIAGDGVAMSYAGEFVRYKANQVFAAGNVVAGLNAKSTGSKVAKNGTVYYLDAILNFSEKIVGADLILLGTPTTSPFYNFFQYLNNASIFTKTTGDIVGVAGGTNYTIFVPDNASILQAVKDGMLPGTGVAPNRVPNFNPTTAGGKDSVNNFIYYHILNKKTVATDGVESGAFETLFKKTNGDATTIFVNNNIVNAMTLTDMFSRPAAAVYVNSNYLSNRCTIHLINNYLKFSN